MNHIVLVWLDAEGNVVATESREMPTTQAAHLMWAVLLKPFRGYH